MIRIKIDNDEYEVPAEWDDFETKQLEFLVRIAQEGTSIEQVKLYMILHCLGGNVEDDSRVWGREIAKKIGIERETVRLSVGRNHYDLKPEDYVTLSDLMYFLFQCKKADEGKYEYALSPQVRNNPYPSLNLLWKECKNHGEYGMTNISFEQYMYLQTFLDGMSSGEATLEQVLACLWHSGETFDVGNVEEDAKSLKMLSNEKKTVMFWYIQGGLDYYRELFPALFGSDGGATERKNVLDSQLRLLDRLANHDVTKKDAIRKGFAMDAFYALDEIVKEQDKLKESMNK